MGWGQSAFVLPALLAMVLVSAGIEDARQRTIANWKNAAVALAAPLWWWAQGLSLWPGVAEQLLLAAIVFALFVGAFAAGWMGGGDAKLIGALALWLPTGPLIWMLIAMSLIGAAVTLAMVIDRAVARRTAPVEVPYGVAIAIAALLSLPRTGF